MQLGTRSQVKESIKRGLVSVNGMTVKNSDFQLDKEQDTVIYRDQILTYQKYYYYMLHKPAGVVTATRDSREPTVMELLSDACGKGLSPVGRLDKDTEGLLLVTNDGDLAHHLLSPKKHVAKIYYVECTGLFTADKLALLEGGVDIGDEELTHPAKVLLVSQSDDSCSIELTITEGRFHQVKRMIQAVGGCVTYLKRLSMGTLSLDSKLPKGCYRPLTEKEIIDLKRLTGT